VTTNPQNLNNNKWIWIGLGAALLFCCCSLLVAFLVFRQAGRTIQQGVKTDPESASQAAHEVVDYDLPDGYKERIAMDMMVYSMVMIGPTSYQSDEPVIMLAQFSPMAGNDKQLEQQMVQSFEQQSGTKGLDMQLVEVKDMTIRNEETSVNIYEGTDQNGNSVRQLITTFPGKDGTVMLLIMGNVDGWDDDKVDAFIESIR